MKRTRADTINTIEESILKRVKFKQQYKEYTQNYPSRGLVKDVDAKNEKDKIKEIKSIELPTVNRLLKKLDKFKKEATERNDINAKDIIMDKIDELIERKKQLEKVAG